MCQRQHTIGTIVNSAGMDVSVRDHPDDQVYCEDRKKYVNREDTQQTSDGKFYLEDTELNHCDECVDCITDDEYNDNDGMCKTCREEREECVNCKTWVLNEDSITCSDGDDWCEQCHNEAFTYCQTCDDSFPNSNCRSDDDGNDFCDSCYDENYTECISCREELAISDSNNAPDCESYCDGCFCETWTNCEDCEEDINRDDSNCHNDMVLCDRCYESASHGDRPEYYVPCNWSGSDVCVEMGSMRKFGVELELTNCDGYSQWLDQGVWGAKTDGSVSDGMEFITAPIAGDDGLAAIRTFCANAEENDFRGANDCGYHLHCDLTGSSPDERKSIALAYHYTCELWHDFINRSRYDIMYSRLNSESKHDYTAYHRRSPDKRKTFWDRKSIIGGDGHPTPDERYIWVNWRAYSKHRTVEIRSHHPTCNGREVTNWVKAHIKFIDYVSTLTVGQVTRTLGGNIKGKQMAEFRHIWKDSDLFDFYNKMYEKRNSHCLV